MKSFRTEDGLAWAAALLTLIAAGAGVFAGETLYRDTPELLRLTIANDVFVLFAALPALVIALILSARGNILARFVVIGALACIAYQFTNSALGLTINTLTLVHAGATAFAVWSLILMIPRVDTDAAETAFGGRVFRRLTAAYLLFMAAITALHWIGVVIPAVSSGQLPADLLSYGWATNPLIIVEFVFLLPPLIVVGVSMLRASGSTAHALMLLMLFALLNFGLILLPVVTALRGGAFDFGVFVFGLVFFILPAALLVPVVAPRRETVSA